MLASAQIGLQVLGIEASRTAARAQSGLAPSWFSGGRIGGRVVGTEKIRTVVLEFSSLNPSGAELGMSLAAGAVLGGQRRIAAIRRVIKKQTGIPLRASWQPSISTTQASTRTAWVAPRAEILSPRQPWGEAKPLHQAERMPWAAQHPNDAARRAAWAAPRDGVVAHLAARRGNAAILGRAIPGFAPIGGAPARNAVVQTGTELQASSRSAWIIATATDSARRGMWGVYSATGDASERSPYTVSSPADSPRRAVWALYTSRADSARRATFTHARRADTPERCPFGARRPLQSGWGVVIEPGGPIVNPDGTIIIPIQRVYLVTNQASITRASDGMPIEALSASVSIDADSWGWSFNATLTWRMWPEIQPGGTRGDPVILQIIINGYPTSVIVETATRGRSFGKTTTQISGRGIAAELAAPFAPVRAFTQTADRTAQQLMNDALTNLGWALDWKVTDWLVPNGTWQHNGSQMDAITGIAGAIRGVVQADPALKTLHILPRYKVAPWHWPTTTPDVQLPLDPIFIDSLERDNRADYNQVFVTGTTGAGRIGQITRDGTAGNLIAPTETDLLITAVEASQQRGLAILGAAGSGWKIGITAPVSDTIPLLQIGQLVQLDPTGENRFGLVRSINLSSDWSDKLKVRQQATLEVKP